MGYKNKNKEKKSSKTWYEKHKGKPVKHKEIKCGICGIKFIQKNKIQKYCSKECCEEAKSKKRFNDYRKRKEVYQDRNSRFYDRNPERLKESSKKFYEENKELRSKQSLVRYHIRYRTDENYKVRKLLGNSLRHVITHYIKTGRIANPMRKYHLDWERARIHWENERDERLDKIEKELKEK